MFFLRTTNQIIIGFNGGISISFCQNCGFEYKEESNFCPSCGQRVGAKPVVPAVSNSSPQMEETTIWEGKPAGFKARCKGQLNTTTYTLTNLRLVFRTGMLSKKEEQIELIRIKDLQLIQGLKDRTLGVGDIRIVSTDENDPKITLQDVKNPVEVKDLIWKAVRSEREKHVRYMSNA
jgi:hypothetical protein